MNNYIVYKHTTPSGKVYVGITYQRLTKRWKNGEGYEGCTAFYRAVKKYGWDKIKHDIIATGLSKEEACEMERALILEYKSYDPEHGYNLTMGGEHYEPTDEWRRKVSESQKRRFSDPEERQRLSEMQIGRVLSDEHKGKISEGVSRFYAEHPERRQACGKSFRGKKRGAEFSAKLSERKSKPIVCVETGTIFKSIVSAADALGIARTGITNQIHGRAKTCGGYTFYFYGGDNGQGN